MALRSDGSIVAWPSYLDLSHAGNDNVAISAGSCYVLALKADGSIKIFSNWDCWDEPYSVPAGNDFIAIAAAPYYHSLALRSNGSIVAWGYNYYGQLDVPAGNNFTAIAAGDLINVALTAPTSGPVRTLTVRAEPNDIGINTIAPSVGQHIYYQGTLINMSAKRFIKCPYVYKFDRWEGNVAVPSSPLTTIYMDANQTVTAVFVDDAKCGDKCHPNFLTGDLNHDCIVDFADFAIFASRWLECTKPECD